MKTLNLSLNALIALCCSLWLMTSCQDDAVESDLLPAPEAENTNQTLVPDDILQLLHSVAESSPEVTANPNARTDRPFVLEYDLSLTISERIENGQPEGEPGEVIEALDGRLTLWPVDSTDIINFVDLGGRDFQLYQGGYVAVTAAGDTIRRRAASVLIEAEENFFIVEILNVPGVGDGVIIPESFNPRSDSEGGAFGFGSRAIITYESDFIEHDNQPEEPTTPDDSLAYRLQIQFFDSDPTSDNPDLGVRNLVDRIFGTLTLFPAEAPLEGDLEVDPSVSFEGDPIYTGTFEFTDDNDSVQTRSVSAAVDLEQGIGYLDVNNVLGTEDAGEVAIATPSFRPDLMFAGISFVGLTTVTNPPTGNPDLPEVLVTQVNGQLIREPSLPQPDIAVSYSYDLSVAIDRVEGQQLTELTGRLDVTLFVDDDAGARFFFTTSDGINSASGLEGGLTDQGTIALATFSSTNSGFDADFLPEPGLGKLVLFDLPTLENRGAIPSAMAFDEAGRFLGEVTVNATITRAIVDGEEVDL